jgi:lysyl-tRNA synthetase class II
MDDTHHSMEQDLIANRVAKLERIRARGDEPFKYIFDRSCAIAEARRAYEEAEAATRALRAVSAEGAYLAMGLSRFDREIANVAAARNRLVLQGVAPGRIIR